MRDTWLEERSPSPPPGHRWLATYTPQEIATIERKAWDGEQITDNHYLRSIHPSRSPMLCNGLLDRRVTHIPQDRHGWCASHVRSHEHFELLCGEREQLPPPPPTDEHARARIRGRRRADEAKVLERFRERLARQRWAEEQMLSAARGGCIDPRRPGSKEAKEAREEKVKPARGSPTRPARSSAFRAERHDLPAAPGWSRWQKQFGGGKHHTERLTGQYCHSLEDVGRCERVPAEHHTKGSQRLTSTKADAFFSGSLRDYSSPRPGRRPASARPASPRGGRPQARGGGRPQTSERRRAVGV